MTNPNKPLPKSLHTVTAIIAVARLLQRLNNETVESAVVSAVESFGYSIDNDPHGLREKALKQMTTPRRVNA